MKDQMIFHSLRSLLGEPLACGLITGRLISRSFQGREAGALLGSQFGVASLVEDTNKSNATARSSAAVSNFDQMPRASTDNFYCCSERETLAPSPRDQPRMASPRPTGLRSG
jgi:hypothetical protein